MIAYFCTNPDGIVPSAGENGRLHANVPSAEVPVDVVTYDDSAADHVAPVSAEAAQVAFEQAGRSSFVRREDAEHPGMHVAGLGRQC